MKFIVELLSFGKLGEVREVEVPWNNLDAVPGRIEQEIFLHGQNEVQPQDHPSVSAGDVIHIGEDRWLVLAVGFKKLTPDEYLLYKEMPRDKRMIVSCLSDQQGPPPPMPRGKL